MNPLEPIPVTDLEDRLRHLAEKVSGGSEVDDLELRHLLDLIVRPALLLRDDYDPLVLDRVLLSGSARREERPPSGDRLPTGLTAHAWPRDLKVPDALRSCGDKCLYDVGLAGRTMFRGVDLQTLGPRAYELAGRVLESLAADRALRDFFDRNGLRRLPLDEEVLFLRQCAARFELHARILRAFLADGPPGPVVRVPGALSTVESPPAAFAVSEPAGPRVEPASSGEAAGPDRESRLAAYERELLLGSLDLEAVRTGLKRDVVDQAGAVDRLCDDLSVLACGTRARPRPLSYFLVGPTGVGKNHLMESLARLLERMWGVEVPFLTLEGPQYAYPADVNELKGATRGFIRSDETGLLAEFHDRAVRAPLSILLVDEVEKAHPQLPRFFLSVMDRGVTLDNRGRLLDFAGCILSFTSNLGYSEIERLRTPIGYGARRTRESRRREASGDLRRGLPPEFLSRLQVLHFQALSKESAGRILDLEIDRIAARYRTRHGLRLTVTPAARRALVEEGFSEEEGARHLVGWIDRVCNVQVSLRLRAASAPLSEEGRRLLERIREARRGRRAVDETLLRDGVRRETRRIRDGGLVVVDWRGGAFVYEVDGT